MPAMAIILIWREPKSRLSCSPLFSYDPASTSVAGCTIIESFIVAGFGSPDPVEDMLKNYPLKFANI